MKRTALLAPLALTALTALIALSGCSASTDVGSSAGDDQATQKVTIALDWLAQPSNAGAYVALKKGYYADAGLDVTVQPGGTDSSSLQIVAGGGAQFGLEYGSQLLQAREKGVDVVALAPTLQVSPAVYVFHSGQNITSLADLNGRTVYTQPASSEWEYTVKKFNLDAVNAVQFQGSYAAFAADERAVAQGYSTETPAALEAQGISVETIPRIDANDYGSVLFTTQKLIDDNPTLVKKFVAATSLGWDAIRDDPRGSAEILSAYIDDKTAADIELEFERQVDYIWTGDALTHQFGWQDEKRWNAIADLSVKQGTISNLSVLDGAWTTQFLPAS
jgi:NitT/TauT family transport system substrate-binding protein